ncbi:MAG: hypothetical protein JWO67_6783 [Streptosporangiaceae bacterium]|nr:hypothetical protein [Streptosporangiaceae bacterium]
MQLRMGSRLRGAWIPVASAAALTCVGCTSSALYHSSSPHSAPPLTSQRADKLSSDLAAGSEAPLRDALAVPSGQSLDPAAASQIAALAPIRFDAATFHKIDAQNATVIGTVTHPPAGQPATWTFTLTFAGGAWRVVDGGPTK